MAAKRSEREMKIVMGFIKEYQHTLKLSTVVPVEIMKLCHAFYHIMYRWDPSTKPNDNVEINAECDIITITKPNGHHHNVFGDTELESNQIHKINFLIHKVHFMHLGICGVDGIKTWLNQTSSGFQGDMNGTSYFTSSNSRATHYGNIFSRRATKTMKVEPLKENDKLCMIVDLITGKIDYEVNGKSVNFNYDIDKDMKYKIAFMAYGQPNKVQIM